MKKTHLTLGMIKDRHLMPVDDYIILTEIPSKMLNLKGWNTLINHLDLCILTLLKKYPNCKSIDLYLTGISRIQHVIIALLSKRNININIYDYSSTDKSYIMITSYKHSFLKGNLSLSVGYECLSNS